MLTWINQNVTGKTHFNTLKRVVNLSGQRQIW